MKLIYITAPKKAEASKIAKALVEARLVACANIFDSVSSVYWWEGKVVEDQESIIVAKTQDKLVDKVISKTKELHSYSVPCIVALNIDEANPDYLKWLTTETKLS